MQSRARETEKPLDAPAILRELSRRWAAAQTMEYRSRVALNHAGELHITVAVHVRLRRPRLARVLLDTADRPDLTRLRVCDGRTIRDRTAGTPSFPPQTTNEPLGEKVTVNIPHPLDEVSYCVDQFFSRAPFTPPPTWGDTDQPCRITGSILPTPANLPTKSREVFRIVQTRGRAQDTLTLEPISLRPLEIVRVGDHAGRVQELLRETFLSIALGAYCPPQIFQWTAADDRGDTIRAEIEKPPA